MDLWICSQELWTLDNRDGRTHELTFNFFQNDGSRIEIKIIEVCFIVMTTDHLKVAVGGTVSTMLTLQWIDYCYKLLRNVNLIIQQGT
jgi:hypothetical protein